MIKQQSEKKNKSTFVKKLYLILKNQRNQNIIQWIENGTAFTIYNKQQFVDEILKQHYKHSKFSSFLKQLNIYGFQRIIDQSFQICYQHPQFTETFVNFNLAKASKRKEPQNINEDDGFFNLMQEIRQISDNQVMMCQQLDKCKQIQQIASSQICALHFSALQCLVRKKEAEYITNMLISIVNGMESQYQNNTQLLYDELFHYGNIQELSLSELATPLSLQYTPTPIQNKKIKLIQTDKKNITSDPDFIWNNNQIE